MTRSLVHRLAAQAQAARDIVRTVGPVRALAVVPRWLLRREFLVFAMPLREVAPGPAPHGVRLAPLEAADGPALRRLHPAMTEAEIRRRSRAGQVCEVGWVGSEAAYYQWLAAGPSLDPYLGRTVVPGRGDFYGVEYRTHPGFRRLGIARWATLVTNRRALERGLRRRLYLVATWNRPSRDGDWGDEVQRLGTVGYWNLGVCRCYFATGAVRLSGFLVEIASPLT